MVEGASPIQRATGQIDEVRKRLGEDYQRIMAAQACYAMTKSLDPERFPSDVLRGTSRAASADSEVSVRTALRGSKFGPAVPLFATVSESDEGETTTYADLLSEDDERFDAVLDALDAGSLHDLIAPYLAKLPAGQREALQLAEAASDAGVSVAAQCAESGTSYDPIKQRLLRARRTLSNVPSVRPSAF